MKDILRNKEREELIHDLKRHDHDWAAERLREARDDRGYTTITMAEILTVSGKVIAQLLCGHTHGDCREYYPSRSLVTDVCTLLRLSVTQKYQMLCVFCPRDVASDYVSLKRLPLREVDAILWDAGIDPDKLRRV